MRGRQSFAFLTPNFRSYSINKSYEKAVENVKENVRDVQAKDKKYHD